LADDLEWPDTEPIGMRRSRNWMPTKHVWTSRKSVGRSALSKTLWYPRAGEPQQGYVFAKLNIPEVLPMQSVAVCRDGLLYSLRHTELDKSRGMGWGRLPEPDIMLAAVNPDPSAAHAYNLLTPFPRPSFEESLISRIKPEHLPPAYR